MASITRLRVTGFLLVKTLAYLSPSYFALHSSPFILRPSYFGLQVTDYGRSRRLENESLQFLLRPKIVKKLEF
jgi:hypothetical protein